MAVLLRTPLSLYAEILGDAWYRLDDAIRCLHDTGGATVCAAGTFQMLQSSHGLVRLLARLLGLPAAAGEAVGVRLLVSAREHGEQWRRTFADCTLVTMQSQEAGTLVERLGIVALHFRLTVRDGALHYQTTRAALRLGWLRLPLPHWLGPQITACERRAGDQIHVSVAVHLTLLGRLLAYDGRLTRIEEPG